MSLMEKITIDGTIFIFHIIQQFYIKMKKIDELYNL